MKQMPFCMTVQSCLGGIFPEGKELPESAPGPAGCGCYLGGFDHSTEQARFLCKSSPQPSLACCYFSPQKPFVGVVQEGSSESCAPML